MKKSGKIMWAIVLIVLGLLIGAKALGILDFNIFFKGWWTLFIIIPSFIGIVSDREKTGHIIGLLIGVALLLATRGVFDFKIVWKLLLPAVVVTIGLSMLFKEIFNKEVNDDIKKLNEKVDAKDGYAATFSGQDIKLNGEEFKGTTLNAVFGGLKLDLKNAIINEDVVINASSIFGGIEIYVPEGYMVKVKSTSIFGGVSNKKEYNAVENTHTIYINATCVFGGVEIK